MAVSPLVSFYEGYSDRNPLLMAQPINHTSLEHCIDIGGSNVASASTSYRDDGNESIDLHCGNRQLPRTLASNSHSPSALPAESNHGNISTTRRGDNYTHHHRSPLNSGFWISVKLIVNVSQIVAATIILCLSRHEHPRAPLFSWVVGYTAGCIAKLPHFYWLYSHRYLENAEQDTTQMQSSSPDNNAPPNSYTSVSISQSSDEGPRRLNALALFRQRLTISNTRLNALADDYKMALDCFFVIWFIVGSVWIFGGHVSASDAPNLYRLCIVFLALSCIGYAMPFILCMTVCCCLPCIISILGVREETNQTRGASPESINVLPTYKFMPKRGIKIGDGNEINSQDVEMGEGGIVGAGTDKEKIFSAEDSVCCICLAKYANNDDLRELPCSHFFHVDCVDKWLKINASCPLCKSEIRDFASAPDRDPDPNPGHLHQEGRVNYFL